MISFAEFDAEGEVPEMEKWIYAVVCSVAMDSSGFYLENSLKTFKKNDSYNSQESEKHPQGTVAPEEWGDLIFVRFNICECC